MSKKSHFVAFLAGAVITAAGAVCSYFYHPYFEPVRNPPAAESPETPRLIVDTASLEDTINESGFSDILIGTRGEDGAPDKSTIRTLIGINHGLFVEEADAQTLKRIRNGYLGEGPAYQTPIQPPAGSQPTIVPYTQELPSQPEQLPRSPLHGPTFSPKYNSSAWRASSE